MGLVYVRTQRRLRRLEWQKSCANERGWIAGSTARRPPAGLSAADRWSEARWVDRQAQVAGDATVTESQDKVPQQDPFVLCAVGAAALDYHSS